MTALTVAAITVLVIGGGALAQQTIGTPTQTLPVTPAGTVASNHKTEVVVYYLVDKPDRPDGGFRPATQITPRTVAVEGTNTPALDAIRALLTAEPPETGLSSGFNFLRGTDDETVDVKAVRHQDGVITIDLTRDPWDPYPNLDLCCPPDGATVTQQLVLTAQTALATDDPVQFTANGKPARGIWFHRLDGPVQADPSIVLPHYDTSDLPRNPTAGRTGPLPDGGAASCVESYAPDALKRRAFAFDGVVQDVGPSVSDRGDGTDLGLPGVTFRVREWFSGGHGDTVTVDMQSGTTGSADPSDPAYAYGIGSRLLVSGEARWAGPPLKAPIAWGCGFSRYYDPETATAWRDALAD